MIFTEKGVLAYIIAVTYYTSLGLFIFREENRLVTALLNIGLGGATLITTFYRRRRICWQMILVWLHRFMVCFFSSTVINMVYPVGFFATINTALLLGMFGELVRYIVMMRLRSNFVGAGRLQWYRDVIKLERVLTQALSLTKKVLSDDEIVEAISRTLRRLDPKVFFSLLCDEPETNALLPRFIVFDIIKNNLQRAGKNPNGMYQSEERCGGAAEESIYSVIQKDLIGVPKRDPDPEAAATIRSKRTDLIHVVSATGGPAEQLVEGHAPDLETAQTRRMIDLPHITASDIPWLTEHNDFIRVYKNPARNCLQVEAEAYRSLRKIDRILLKGVVTLDSLRTRLSNAEATTCFRILSQKFESVLSYTDFEGSMRQLNNMRGCFISTMQNNEHTLLIIGNVFLAIEVVVILGLLYFIFKLTTFYELFLSFLLGPVIWAIFEAFMFLIVSHPYDVGDRVYIDGVNLIVRDIGLTCTTFEKWNNECVIIANTYIRSRQIQNIRRSKNQQWRIAFYMPADTPEEAINSIRQNLRRFVEQNPAFEHITITFDEIRECHFYKVSFIVKHAINHQNGFFMWKVQNKFMAELVKECNANGIVYTNPEATLHAE